MQRPRTQLVYAIGIEGDEGDELIKTFREVQAWPDHEPERHEFLAHLLIMAYRKEVIMIDLLRKMRAERRRRDERRRAKG